MSPVHRNQLQPGLQRKPYFTFTVLIIILHAYAPLKLFSPLLQSAQRNCIKVDGAGRRILQGGGYEYDFKSHRLYRKRSQPEVPEIMKDLRNLVRDHLNIRLPLLMVNCYHREQGVDAHRDSLDYGDHVAVVSTGGSAVLTFRHLHGGDTFSVLLKPRSLFVISGPLRNDSKHFIEPSSSVDPRASFTFRSLALNYH